MSYRIGPYVLKRARDFVGRRVLILDEQRNRGGDVFPEGSEAEIRGVWKGCLKLVVDDGTCRKVITGVRGYAVQILSEDAGSDDG